MIFENRRVEFPDRYKIEETVTDGEKRYRITPDEGRTSGADGQGGFYSPGTALTAELLTEWTQAIETGAVKDCDVLVGSGFNVDYYKRLATPRHACATVGCQHYLRFADKNDGSADFGCTFTDVRTYAADPDPSYGLVIGNPDSDADRLAFLYYPERSCLGIRRWRDWAELISRAENVSLLTENHIRVRRYKADGKYSYGVYINDKLFYTYTDEAGVVGEQADYYMGTVGCNATIGGWHYKPLQ